MAAGDVSDGLVADVRARSGYESIQQITDDQIFRFLNRGQQYLGLSLRFGLMPPVLKRASDNLVGSMLTLPTDFMFEQVLMIGDDEVVARPFATAQYDTIVGNTYHDPSTSSPYYQVWRDLGLDAIRLKVYVGNAASTAAYVLDYVAIPADIDTDTDPVFSVNLQDMMVEFAVARVREQQRNPAEKERLFAVLHQRINTLNTRYDLMRPRADVLAPTF